MDKKKLIKTTIGLAILGVTGTVALIGYKIVRRQKIFPIFEFNKKEENKEDEQKRTENSTEGDT